MSNSNMELKICKCKMCGKDFECTHRRKYCGDECKREARLSKLRVPKVTKNCEWCGKEFEGNNDYRIKFCSMECQQTSYSRVVREVRPVDEYREERERKKVIAKIAKLINKEVLKQDNIERLTRPCVECGTPFYNPQPLALTCSPLCSKRRKNRIKQLRNSKRLNEHNIVDKDITVQKLFDKYDGICYLCGKKCDFNDKVITEEGYVIVGKTYPSIEHVIPISKGGLHSWDNVNLAHHYCNALKSDKYIF